MSEPRQVEQQQRIITALQNERDGLRRNLGNLLAVIHRDGGHYQGENGDDKASEDAQMVVCNLRTKIDNLRGLLEEVASHSSGPEETHEGARWVGCTTMIRVHQALKEKP